MHPGTQDSASPRSLKYALKTRSANDLFNGVYVMFLCACFLLLIFFMKALTNHCNSNGYPSIWLYKEVDKKYTGYNLKTMELLDCALVGVCAVIRSNMIIVIIK